MPDVASISRRSCAAILIAGLVAAQSAIFFSGRTLLPIAPSVTTIAGVPYGYSGPVSNGEVAVDPAGSLNFSYLLDVYSLASFKEGTLPFWNPFQGLGQPQLANGLSAVLNPLNLLFFVVPHPWWDIVYLMNWLLAAFFVTEFLRLIGARREGIVVGGVAVLGSGFFQYYLVMREVVAVAAFFPLLLYAVERTAREPQWRFRHVVVAVAVACCLTAGQPESSFIALALSALYALVTIATLGENRWQFVRGCLPGAIAGLMLSAPFWLSFSDYAFRAYSNHPAGSHMGQIDLGTRSAATYLIPFLFGRMQTTPFGASVPGWMWNFSPGWMPSAVGLLALAGLVVAIRERHRPVALTAAMGLLIAGKIWGIPGPAILGHLPMFDRVIYPRYAAFVVAICFAVLAGVGCDRLIVMARRRAVHLTLIWIGGVLTLYAWSTVWTLPAFNSREVRLYSALGLSWAILIPSGLLWLKARGRHELIAVAASTAILLQLAAFLPGYRPIDYLGLSAAALGVWCGAVVVAGIVRFPANPVLTAAAALSVVALTGVTASAFSKAGLAQRYDVLTVPPYLSELQRRQTLGERVYAVDGNPQPTFGAALRVHSLNTLEILAPPQTAGFITTYLDRGADPLWLSGTTGGRRNSSYPPVSELIANERYFDLVGVRYLTSTNSSPLTAFYDTGRVVSAAPVPRPLVEAAESWVDAPATIAAVEVYLSTYAQRNPGILRLEVLDASRRVLGQSEIDAAQVVDNSYATFAFPSIALIAGSRLGLRLTFEPGALGSMLAVWEYPPDAAASFVFRVLAEESRLRKVMTDSRTGVTIWERLGALPRAFLATDARVVPEPTAALGALAAIQDLRRHVVIDAGPELHSEAGTADPGRLIALQVSPNRVFIRYQANTAGILTLTDSYAPGWTATINGQPAHVMRVNGAFRGVRIPASGEYVVEYAYRPPTWMLSCGVAVAGVFALAALTFAGRRA